MKNASLMLLITILFVIAGCGGCRRSATGGDGFVAVDVTAHYPEKELILQDFMDVEYVPLETTDSFICQDLVLDITESMILVRNYPEDGDLFIFDRNGNALKKINRRGQGAEEYNTYRRAVLDEGKAELFVNDIRAHRIVAYDLDGNFKRSFRHKEGASYQEFYNFDPDHLFCCNWAEDGASFAIISKQDGSIAKEISIPYEKKVSVDVKFELNGGTYSGTYYTRPDNYYPAIPQVDNWILADQSADTVYGYQPGRQTRPLIVRTPPVQSMPVPRVLLFPGIATDRYHFMDVTKLEFDGSKYFDDGYEGFPTTFLMYDQQAGVLFEYIVYNGDYTDKRPVRMNKSILVKHDEIAACQSLQADRLIEDYENGKLRGRLKEIAAGLNDESNPVLVLLKRY
jgi:hypothetical protein